MSKQKKMCSAAFVAAISIIFIAGTCAQVYAGAGIVTNSSFSEVSADARTPAGWDVPPDSPWSRTDADGHRGNTSIRYSARSRVAAGPVTQRVSLEAATEYVLYCSIKPAERLSPVVRIKKTDPEGIELVRIVGDGAPELWEAYLHGFNSGAGGEVVVELWADILHLQRGSATPAGTAGIDDVRIVTADRAGELLTETPEASSYENLARGKKYTFTPPAAYGHTRDPGDLEYLTDGQYTEGYFWTQKTTVGWLRVPEAEITMDLGGHYPIRGISVNTAFGVAGVRPPAEINILASEDGRRFHHVGELVALSGKRNPITGGYSVHRFYTDELQFHGRYIKLRVILDGNTFFTDEIEVYRGKNEWKDIPLPGEPVLYPREHYGRDLFNTNLLRRVEKDINMIHAEIRSRELPSGLRNYLEEEMEKLDQAVQDIPDVSPEGFRGIMPLNEVHASVYGLMGAVRGNDGHPPVVAWSANPWDFLEPIELPEDYAPAEISVAAMKGEERAGALNLTNCTQEPITARLSFEGLPGGSNPDYIKIHEVPWTDTNENVLVAAALPEASLTERGWKISLPAGMTRQVWFSFKPEGISAGSHSGHLLVEEIPGPSLRVPVRLRVFNIEFPERPRLSVGGWDYTNTYMYGVTRQNRDELIEYLQSRFVDAPWATPGVMGYGKFDSEGDYMETPSTASFDQWVDNWPDARRYHVFNFVDRHSDIDGTEMGDDLFEKKAAAWINFWVEHAKSRGIPPDMLFLLLVDESSTVEQDNMIIAWSNAIKAAQPEVIIWDDGSRSAERITPELMEAVDFFCPGRVHIKPGGRGEHTLDLYSEFVRAGGRLDLYSCMDRVRLRDPYTYHRLQAWDVFKMGGEGTQFWSFSGRAGSSWNEYEARSPDFAPFFIEPAAITSGKHMEAIRESVADFEYLSMLADSIENLENNDPRNPLLPEARELAAVAADRVLSAHGATKLMWVEDKDRSIADEVRLEIGELLEKLK